MSENTTEAKTEEKAPAAHGIPTPQAGGTESGAGNVTDPMPDEEAVREALKDVIDPEIGINLVDLGLIYKVDVEDEKRIVNVDMTLTSPGFPVGPELKSAVWLTVKRMNGVADCDVNLVWKPRWDPSVHASEEAQMFLGIW